MRTAAKSEVSLFDGFVFGSWELFKMSLLPSMAITALADEVVVAPSVQVNQEQVTTNPDGVDVTLKTDTPGEGGLNKHRQTLQSKVDLLKKGRTFLLSKRDYTAIIDKREVVRGEMCEEQSMVVKCRVKPFSLYLCWTAGDVGREVIYVEGTNDGKMIAHDGGWKSKLPAFTLEPDCALAMRDARYPVTTAGLLFLIETMIEAHENDLERSTFQSCQILEDQQFDGRPCTSFTTLYGSKEVSPVYRKCVTLIEHNTFLPLSTEHFEWPTENDRSNEKMLDDATLVERYSFRRLAFDQQLVDLDFDRANPEYHFR